ncbi:unnamed protein product, partial [Vitis vinifera]
MTPLSVAVAAVVTVVIAAVSSPALVHGLGSGSTLAVSYGSGAVCGVVAGERYQRIECYRGGETISIEPNISSFSSISGGRDFFCGLRSGGFALFCWNTSFVAKRIYFNYTVLLENLAVGDDQVCATVNGTGVVKCWRGENSSSLSESSQFSSISSGLGFSCGILVNNRTVQCWGSNTIANQIQQEFGNTPMLSIMAGGSHVCGLNTTGYLLCEGSNDSGQLNVPSGSAYEFSNLSLGENHSCAIRQSNGSKIHNSTKKLVGFCQEMDERLLVYEYMKNGALYDHLHDKNNIEKSSNVLNSWNDVYGLGVVLLELLTGKRAIFKDGENGGTPISVVDFAVPAIIAGELMKVLDPRVGPPQTNEAEAVELVAYTAMHCVNLEGKERPTMADIVANLERALALCEDSHGSISSGTISIVSD